MLYVIDSSNGSGKTVWVVRHLVKNYYIDVEGVWEPVRPVRLVSNIDGLLLPHCKLDEEIKAIADLYCDGDYRKGVSYYFSNKNQEQLAQEYGEIVYMIDEAQMFFPDNFKDYEVFNWLQLHRHYGQTIYMTTQNKNLLARQVLYCCEYVIRAEKASKKFYKNQFMYHYISADGKEKMGTVSYIIPSSIFSLYKSTSLQSTDQPKRLLLKTITILLIIASIIFTFSAYGFYKKWNKFKSQTYSQTSDQAKSFSKKNNNELNNYKINHNISGGNYSYKSDTTLDVSSNLVRKKISFFIDFKEKGTKKTLKLIYNGVFLAEQFPYKYEFVGKDCYAFIPDDNDFQNVNSKNMGNTESNHFFGSKTDYQQTKPASGPLLITVGG